MPRTSSDQLIESIHTIARAKTMHQLSADSAKAACDLVGAQGSAFVVRVGEECLYLDEHSIEPLWKGQKFPLTACVCGWTILNRKPAAVPDVLNDPRVPARYYEGRFMKSLLAAPMRTERPIGALAAYWKDCHAPTQKEIQTLQTLADSAALGIENINLMTRLEQAKQDAEHRAAEQEAMARHLTFMMQELDHRVKNTLASVLGLCDLTYQHSESFKDFSAAYRGRLGTMARTHEMLAATKWQGVPLLDLVRHTALERLTSEGDRIVIEGPDVLLPPTSALPIAVTLHELVTNAVKFGAWSNDAVAPGHLSVAWTLDSDHALRVHWREFNGPAITPPDPNHSGFGTMLIRGMIAHELRGEVDLRFPPTGVECDITVPNADVEVPMLGKSRVAAA